MARDDLVPLARALGVDLPSGWRGLDAVWALVLRIQEDGSVFVVKVDGERGVGDTGPYTVLVSGVLLPDGPLRSDGACLEDALAAVLCAYARRVWAQAR